MDRSSALELNFKCLLHHLFFRSESLLHVGHLISMVQRHLFDPFLQVFELIARVLHQLPNLLFQVLNGVTQSPFVSLVLLVNLQSFLFHKLDLILELLYRPF